MFKSLYIHIPFCAAKCGYCGFFSVAGKREMQPAYVRAVEMECGMYGIPAGSVETVYIGGGTPTSLDTGSLERLLMFAAGMAAPGAEFTVEVNPGTVTPDVIGLLRQAGVNRISCGVQSFNDRILKYLGRIHDAAGAESTVQQLQKRGFSDVSIDLMFAIPGQEPGVWEKSLHRAINLEPSHISLYGLSVEPGTVFERNQTAGTLNLPDDDAYAGQYGTACRLLPEAGLSQYELSNFSRPGHTCRHNTVYWERKPYLGLGASAHSYRFFRRWWNHADVEQYVKLLGNGTLPEEGCEVLDDAARQNEAVFLGLRMMRGLALSVFADEFGAAAVEALEARAVPLVRDGMLGRCDNRLFLTPAGLPLADSVTAALL